MERGCGPLPQTWSPLPALTTCGFCLKAFLSAQCPMCEVKGWVWAALVYPAPSAHSATVPGKDPSSTLMSGDTENESYGPKSGPNWFVALPELPHFSGL